jgi:hypothetical protein
MLVLWMQMALAHCIQLDDGNSGAAKTWGTAERVNPSGNAAEVAVDPAGNAVAVWSEAGGIFSSRYTPADGWSTAVLIPNTSVASGNAMVAMDADGRALAVWPFEWVGSNIVCIPSNASGEWDSFEPIDDGEGEAFDPQISMGADGSAVAVWTQFDDERDDVWSNRYTRGEGWSFAQRIETSLRDASSPQVAVDAEGIAVAVWEQSDGTRYGIWSNRYTPSAGWGVAERIETEEAGDATSPQVAMDAEGNAFAVWRQFDGGIWSNTCTPSRGWGTAERIDAGNTTDAREPRVAVDPGGSAVSVWRQSGTTGDGIWSNRYTRRAQWGSAQRIDSNHPGARSAPRVAVDANGNAIALWSISGGSASGIWFNRLE